MKPGILPNVAQCAAHADIHLYAPDFSSAKNIIPGKSPQDDLISAEKLINECGYHRRDEELADAKLAILGHS